MSCDKKETDGKDKDWDCFIWSDNWHIEGSEAWFVDGLRDALCYINLKKNKCEYIVNIPNNETCKFRLNPRCLKIENEIYLMPDLGKKVWVYNLKNDQFEHIEIDNPNSVRLGIYKFWVYDHEIYALSVGLKKIIEINIEKNTISNYFAIPIPDGEEMDNDAGIRVGENIYCASSSLNQIYQFHLKSKQIITHVVPEVEGGFQTISFDGHLFWLSGNRKEIYLWDKENSTTKVLNDFPPDFGIYDFLGNCENILDRAAVIYNTQTFVASMTVGDYIWFIPYQTNNIIYVDQATYQIYTLEVEEEEEERGSLLKHSLCHKYLVQYIREERYIGLFSLKNNYIFEIDAVEKKVEKKSYIIDEKSISKLKPLVCEILNERNELDRIIFSSWLTRRYTQIKDDVDGLGVGASIYLRCN